MFLKSLFLAFLVITYNGAAVPVDQKNIPPPDLPNSPGSTSINTGSFFEYAIRNILRNMVITCPNDQNSHFSIQEQIIYFYHLQILSIDLRWTQNYERANPNTQLLIFHLPSRAVRNQYTYDVDYIFGDGVKRTLDSHRLQCDECTNQFQANLNQLYDHNDTYIDANSNSVLNVNDASIETGTGSYFEYVVRNVLRHAQTYFPLIPNTINHITTTEQMVYYYHLQMMHIDLMWTRIFVSQHPYKYPSPFQLPSRAVQYLPNIDVSYNFANGQIQDLDSHRLQCNECLRQFHCNVEQLHNFRIIRFVLSSPSLYTRRIRTHQASNPSPLRMPSVSGVVDSGTSRPSYSQVHYSSCPVQYSTTTSSTTESVLNSIDQNVVKRFRHDGKELRLRSSLDIQQKERTLRN